MNITPEEVRLKLERKRDEALAVIAPKTVKTITTKQQDLDAAIAELEALRHNSIESLELERKLLLSLGEEKTRLETLQGLQGAVANLPALAKTALNELLNFQLKSDPYSGARWVNAGAEIGRLSAIAPVLPAATEECQAVVKALEAEIRQTAKDSGIELGKLLNYLQAEAREGTDQRLHTFFESGYFEFAR